MYQSMHFKVDLHPLPRLDVKLMTQRSRSSSPSQGHGPKGNDRSNFPPTMVKNGPRSRSRGSRSKVKVVGQVSKDKKCERCHFQCTIRKCGPWSRSRGSRSNVKVIKVKKCKVLFSAYY